MRELHGVSAPEQFLFNPELNRMALLFHKIHVIGLDDLIATSDDFRRKGGLGGDEQQIQELHFLRSNGFLANVDEGKFVSLLEEVLKAAEITNRYNNPEIYLALQAFCVRDLVNEMNENGIDSVGLFHKPLVPNLAAFYRAIEIHSSSQDVMVAGLHSLPIPSNTSSWQDIVAFKAELYEKQWDFRMFLRDLATKQQTETEIRERLEYTLDLYSRAMKVHRLKASSSFVDVFVITPLEIIENLVKFNWSKIANGALRIQKRKVELMEAELKAPGRECAYVFDARKRFGIH